MRLRPRLLFVTPRYLLPADSGGKIRTGHVLRGLKGGRFDVTLLSPAPDGAAAGDATPLAAMCDRFEGWPEPMRGPLFRYSRMRHLASRLPVSVATDRSAAANRLIAAALASKPDVVVVDFTHTAVLFPKPLDIPTVLFTHNVEAEIFARHRDKAASVFARAIWRDQYHKMRAFEHAALHRFATVIAVSERDAAQLRNEYGVAAAVIPTGVDLDYFAAAPAQSSSVAPGNIVFTASMDSAANIEGIEWFMDAVWPRIAAAEAKARVTVVGRNPASHLVRAAERKGLPWIFTGFVEDVRPHVHDADVYVIPLRVGSGTRIKVFEAMALGCPVVSTALGCEGLPLEPERHYLRADAPEDFAAAVVRLLRDGALRAKLASAARRLVEENYSSAKVGAVFEEICAETLTRHAGTSSPAAGLTRARRSG